MNKESAVVVATLDVIKNNPGISINGVMQKIGVAHGGPGTYSNNQVFAGVQYLKASGDIKVDDRVKKNQPLYAKGVKLAKEPVKVSFRKKPEPKTETEAATATEQPAA